MFKTTSVRGDAIVLSSLCIELFNTSNFSRKVQFSFKAASIDAAICGVASLYKYNGSSSGVKLIMSKPLMSKKQIVREMSGIETGYRRPYCAKIPISWHQRA